ncbi:MAG: metal-dependent transcriptional regulator [Actinomycetota bacterium]|jgi:DtxR family transcriptional regulator, Mn-dependent transcriptional regulator
MPDDKTVSDDDLGHQPQLPELAPAPFTEALDQYLEAILELEEEGARVIQARLVARLGISPPSVSEMFRRLRAEGYVSVAADRTVSLTEKGREAATAIVRRHRLAERFLVDVLGLPWHRSHVEARRWEHAISADVESLIDAKLENPQTCPHGNPIPGSGVLAEDLVPLSETQVGERLRLERVSEELEMDYDALVYLDRHGFIPGAEGVVSTVAPDRTRLLTVGDSTIAVGRELATKLYIRRLKLRAGKA